MKSVQILILSLFILISCEGTKQVKETPAGEQTSIDTEQKIERNGLYIHHQSTGDGPLTLLFVHGWCIDQSYWSAQVEALAPAYRVVTIDVPGFGQSGKNREEWSIEAYGSDVNAVINQLNLRNVVLIGHSMGGDIILEAALQNENVIALVGVDNFKDVGIEFDEQTQAEIDGFLGMLEQNFTQVAQAYAENALFQPQTDSVVKQRILESLGKSDSTIALSALKKLLEYTPKESTQLTSLKQKLYLINSTATPTSLDGLNAAGINYEVIDIEATSHYPMIEKPAIFNTLLKQALKKIEKDYNPS